MALLQDTGSSQFGGYMKYTPFRCWVNNMWHEYRSEYLSCKVKPTCKDAGDYFRENRWFLREKYRQKIISERNSIQE